MYSNDIIRIAQKMITNQFVRFALVSFILLGSVNGVALAQGPEISWIDGPTTVDLGIDLAQVELGEQYAFAGAADTKMIMEAMGNPSDDSEVGLIIPKSEESNWFVVFEHAPIGYIRDDDKDSLDADAILESIKSGTEAANEIRKEQGFSELSIVGWYEKPHYDEESHNLVWAVLAESGDQEGQTVNYNIRLLGRTGYMSVVLVTDPETLDTIKPELDGIIENFSYKVDQDYAAFIEGDKVAEYGLTALVAGGAGAAAAKAGLFKTLSKFGKYIFMAVVGVFVLLWSRIKSLFGGKKEEIAQEPAS